MAVYWKERGPFDSQAISDAKTIKHFDNLKKRQRHAMPHLTIGSCLGHV